MKSDNNRQIHYTQCSLYVLYSASNKIIYTYSIYKNSRVPVMIMQLIKILFVLVILDAIYISIIKNQFENMIIQIQKVAMSVRYIPTIIVYILMTVGLYYFIISKNKSVTDAFLLGLLIYGVYEMTNYATIRKWSLRIAVTDILWGGILFGLTTYIIYRLK